MMFVWDYDIKQQMTSASKTTLKHKHFNHCSYSTSQDLLNVTLCLSKAALPLN